MSKQKKSILTGALFISIILILFLPGVSFSGSLEPSDPPGPTMHTLDELYNKPLWHMFDKVFVDWPANTRFSVCDNETPDDTRDDMVLDKETGLVWQRSPWNGQTNWWSAQNACIFSAVGNRFGWRLPTVHELQSLMAYQYDCWPMYFPCGHPFIDLDYCYWSATEWPWGSDEAIYFCPGSGHGAEPKTRTVFANWCVRGGFGVNLDISFP